MSPGYRVKTVVLSSGERLPVLLDRDGMPMFDPVVFALTEVRGEESRCQHHRECLAQRDGFSSVC